MWRLLYNRGRFLLVSTSSTEDDSSIVSLQARFSDLLLLRWCRRLLFWVVRVIRLPAAPYLRPTCVAPVGRQLGAYGISTQQLLLRACMWIECGSVIVPKRRPGNRPSTSDLGHESAQGCAGCCAETFEPKFSSNGAPLLQ